MISTGRATACRIEGGIDGRGAITAWSHKVAAPSIFARFFPQRVKGGVDPAAVEGIVERYEVPNVLVEYVRVETPVPVRLLAFLSAGSHNAFTVECFLDELAHLAQTDPLEFRLSHLRNQPRGRRVLEVAAEKARWGSSRSGGQGPRDCLPFLLRYPCGSGRRGLRQREGWST